MKQVVTKYTCDRCGTYDDRPGENAGEPESWEYILKDKYGAGPTKAEGTDMPAWQLCCAGCVESFDHWFNQERVQAPPKESIRFREPR